MSDDTTLNEFTNHEGSNSHSRWRSVKLGDISEYQNGNAFSKSEWTDSGYPIIRIQNLTGEQDDFNYFDGELEDKYRVQRGDTLFSWSGTIDVFTWDGSEAALNQHIHRVDTTEDISDVFFRFKLEHLLPQLEALSHGSTMKHVRKADLVNLDVDVPPLSEQRKIATVLHTVDQAIQKTEGIIEQSGVVKSGVIQQVFTEGTKEHDTFRETKSGKVPKEWELEPFEAIIRDTRYGTDAKSNTDGEGYPTLRIPNVVEKRITLNDLKYTPIDEDELDRLELKENDILVVRTNGNPDYVGRCATFSEQNEPFVFASYLIRLRVDESRVRPEYIREFLNSRRGRSEMAGWIRSSAGNYNLSVGAIENFQIPIPSLREQDEIIEQIEAVERTVSINRRYLRHLQRLKQGLMQDLLSGTVRTTDTNIEVPDEIAQYG